MGEFELKEEHLKLLENAEVRWEDCEFGAPAIDCKRPYGNSSAEYDICEILGIEEDKSNEDSPYSQEDLDYANKMHVETETALAIILQTRSFTLGTYEMACYKWELIEDKTYYPTCEVCGKVCKIITKKGRTKEIRCEDHPGSHASGNYSYVCGSDYCRCCQ